MQPLLVFAVVFLAIFTQSATGFGLALISMPLLGQLLGIQAAAPLVALVAITAEVVLALHYRSALSLRTVGNLAIPSFLGVPLGILLLDRVNEATVLTILGWVVLAYAAYALANLKLPELRHPAWAYGMGFLAGVLGGAYNVAGPPVIIYGHCRRWPPAEFKGNLQGFFVALSAWVAASHAWGGNLSPFVWRNYLLALLGIGMGIWFGLRIDRWIDAEAFRRLVLGLLAVLGLGLLL